LKYVYLNIRNFAVRKTNQLNNNFKIISIYFLNIINIKSNIYIYIYNNYLKSYV